MRLGYRIVLSVTGTAVVLVVLSWFLANDGYWFYWILEVLGFSLLIVFGGVGMMLPMYYWSAGQRNSGQLGSTGASGPNNGRVADGNARKCPWCGAHARIGAVVCPVCGKALT